jgi:hypothetical protein
LPSRKENFMTVLVLMMLKSACFAWHASIQPL